MTITRLSDGTSLTAAILNAIIDQTNLNTEADTGWSDITITGNWSFGAANHLRYRLIGNRLYFKGTVQRITTTFAADGAWATGIFSIPAANAPVSLAIFTAIGSTQGTLMQIRLNTDGSMDIRNMGTAALAVNQFMDLYVQGLATD